MVSYQTLEMKNRVSNGSYRASQRSPKGKGACQPGQTDGPFFNSQGLIYMHIVPWDASINANNTIKSLCKFLEHFNKKRPTMAQLQWWFHWDNAPVHTASSVKDRMAAKGMRVWSIRPIPPVWHLWTSFCSGEWRRPWQASHWTNIASRMRGRGSPEASLMRTSPGPSGCGLNGLKVRWDQQQLSREIVENKGRPPSYCCLFMNTVQFAW